MTSATVMLLGLALAQGAPVETADTGPGRSGLYGWGLGLELPMVGLTSGIADKSRVGWGYNLGAAVSWEIVPTVLVRAYVAGGETEAAEAPVSFQEPGGTVQQNQPARWRGIEVGFGGAYQFRSDSAFTPYAGLDGGLRFSGYEFDFEDDLEKLQGTTAATDEVVQNDTLGLGWTVAVRGGLRMELTRWLQTLAELQVALLTLGDVGVENTLPHRRVMGVPEVIVLTRMTFSIRLGL